MEEAEVKSDIKTPVRADVRVDVKTPVRGDVRADVKQSGSAPRRDIARPDDDEKRQNTKICRFVEITFKKTPTGNKTQETNKCRRANCTYAHSLAKWTPRPCRFQTGCRSAEACPFKHSNETVESYYERTKNMS